MAWDPVGRIRFKIVAMVGRGDINFARNYSLVCAEIFGNAVRVWFLKRGGGKKKEEEFVESMRENYIRLEKKKKKKRKKFVSCFRTF